MDCILPGSSVHGISQASILEWVTIFFSRESSPGIEPSSPALQADSLPVSHQGRPYTLVSCPLSFTSLSLNISVKCLILSQHLLLSLPPAPSYSWFNQLIQWISADPRAGQNRCHPQPQTTGLEWEVASHHYKWIAFYLQPIFGGKKWLLRLAAAWRFF